jgi:hypothetical protein
MHSAQKRKAATALTLHPRGRQRGRLVDDGFICFPASNIKPSAFSHQASAINQEKAARSRPPNNFLAILAVHSLPEPQSPAQYFPPPQPQAGQRLATRLRQWPKILVEISHEYIYKRSHLQIPAAYRRFLRRGTLPGVRSLAIQLSLIWHAVASLLRGLTPWAIEVCAGKPPARWRSRYARFLAARV